MGETDLCMSEVKSMPTTSLMTRNSQKISRIFWSNKWSIKTIATKARSAIKWHQLIPNYRFTVVLILKLEFSGTQGVVSPAAITSLESFKHSKELERRDQKVEEIIISIDHSISTILITTKILIESWQAPGFKGSMVKHKVNKHQVNFWIKTALLRSIWLVTIHMLKISVIKLRLRWEATTKTLRAAWKSQLIKVTFQSLEFLSVFIIGVQIVIFQEIPAVFLCLNNKWKNNRKINNLGSSLSSVKLLCRWILVLKWQMILWCRNNQNLQNRKNGLLLKQASMLIRPDKTI